MQLDQNPYRIRDLPGPKALLLLQPLQTLRLKILAGKHHRDSRWIRANKFSSDAPAGLTQGHLFSRPSPSLLWREGQATDQGKRRRV